MFSKWSISEISIITETLVFSRQLNIIYPFSLHLKYLPSFISCDISISKFRDLRIIVTQSELDRYGKEILLLNISTQEEPMTTLKGILDVVYIIVKDLAFFQIWFVTSIYL